MSEFAARGEPLLGTGCARFVHHACGRRLGQATFGFNAEQRHYPFTRLSCKARAAVWPFLLGVYPPHSTREDVVRLRRVVVADYASSKNSWLLLPVRESDKVRDKIKDIYKVGLPLGYVACFLAVPGL